MNLNPWLMKELIIYYRSNIKKEGLN